MVADFLCFLLTLKGRIGLDLRLAIHKSASESPSPIFHNGKWPRTRWTCEFLKRRNKNIIFWVHTATKKVLGRASPLVVGIYSFEKRLFSNLLISCVFPPPGGPATTILTVEVLATVELKPISSKEGVEKLQPILSS